LRTSEPALSGELVVFAAASLCDAYSALAQSFQARHPGVKVTFDFAGTQQLRVRAEQGAPFDVFASADKQHMDALLRAQLVAPPHVFARNSLVVVVAKEAAQRVTSFAELPKAERIVLGTDEVPVGRYSLQVLQRASQGMGRDFASSVMSKVVSRELNVRQVLAKVRLGEADAGLVYRTDAATAPGELTVLAIPEGYNVISEYWLAVASHTARAALAAEWSAWVDSAEGRGALAKAGFLPAATTAP